MQRQQQLYCVGGDDDDEDTFEYTTTDGDDNTMDGDDMMTDGDDMAAIIVPRAPKKQARRHRTLSELATVGPAKRSLIGAFNRIHEQELQHYE